MQVTIAKVGEILYQGQARSLTVPGTSGEMTVLGHHMPLVTTLKAGNILLQTEEGKQEFAIAGGVLEVTPQGATVIL